MLVLCQLLQDVGCFRRHSGRLVVRAFALLRDAGQRGLVLLLEGILPDGEIGKGGIDVVLRGRACGQGFCDCRIPKRWRLLDELNESDITESPLTCCLAGPGFIAVSLSRQSQRGLVLSEQLDLLLPAFAKGSRRAP